MLGDKLGETRGKVTGQRVLPGDDFRYVKMEVTIQESGTVMGREATNMATYVVVERVPGQLYGDGQGLVATMSGEAAIWNGHGVGRLTGQGMAMSFRFSVAYQAQPGGSLEGLNKVLVIGEHEVDADGNTVTTYWEWK
jgi:hypothetical protein